MCIKALNLYYLKLKALKTYRITSTHFYAFKMMKKKLNYTEQRIQNKQNIIID